MNGQRSVVTDRVWQHLEPYLPDVALPLNRVILNLCVTV